jgi:hypothetical protein
VLPAVPSLRAPAEHSRQGLKNRQTQQSRAEARLSQNGQEYNQKPNNNSSTET